MVCASDRALGCLGVALVGLAVWLGPTELAALMVVNATTWLVGYPATERYLRALVG